MKKLLIVSAIAGLTAACGATSRDQGEEGSGTSDPDYQKGLSLVAEYRCMTCHTVSDPLTGPPYREVAKKYSNYPDTIISHLAKRVIRGGKGVWGEVYMIPHPSLSEDDAEAMVKYILMLDK
jgi:cytochrome c